jgi:tetratricopeptide (TPR) repeat protein
MKRHLVRARGALGALWLVAAGCDPGNSRLLSLHMADDQRSAARQRWNTVRGDVKTHLAEEHLRAGRIKDAEQVLDEALQLSPTDAKVYLLAARLRLGQGRLADAREAIDMAASLDTRDPEILYLAGLIAQRYGDLAGAHDHFARAVTLGPRVAKYLSAQAEVLVALDRPVDAQELLAPRLVDFDQDVGLRILAARICRILGLRRPVVDYCRDAVDIGGREPSLLAELGAALAWAGRPREAIDVLSPLVEAASADGAPAESSEVEAPGVATEPSVYHDLARALLDTNQPARALRVLQTMLRTDGASDISWHLFARASAEAGDVDRATEALSELKSRGALTIETQLLAACVASQRGDWKQAEVHIEDVLRRDAKCADAYCLLARVAEAQGDHARAWATCQKALSIDPNSEVAGLQYDLLSGGTGAFDDALEVRLNGGTEWSIDVTATAPGGTP